MDGENNRKQTSPIIPIALGALAGAASMYLSKKENREKLKAALNNAKEKTTETVGAKVGEVKQTTSETLGNLQQKLDQGQQSANDQIEKAKDKLGKNDSNSNNNSK